MPHDLLAGGFYLLCIGLLFGAGLIARTQNTTALSMLAEVAMLWRAGQFTAEQATLKLDASNQMPAAVALVDPLYPDMCPAAFMRILDRRLAYAQKFPATPVRQEKSAPEKGKPAAVRWPGSGSLMASLPVRGPHEENIPTEHAELIPCVRPPCGRPTEE